MKISVLGTGRWASCVALCLDRKNHNVLMWEREHEGRPESTLFTTRKNQYVTLSENVDFTHDLKKALDYGDVVVISILSQHLDSFFQVVKAVPGYEKKRYILAMKGIEATTGRRLSEIVMDNGVNKENIAVWVGPGHVQNISAGQPTDMLISAYRPDFAKELIDEFRNPGLLDLVYSEDIVGSEIGAAAKNVMGIAAGILEGSNLEQKKGPLMPASVKEIGKFINAMGGDEVSAQGLAFLGDFQATLFDKNSKNLTFGTQIVKQKTTDREILQSTIDVGSVEGIMTAKALIKNMIRFNARVSNDKQLKMPITESVDAVVSNRVPIDRAGLYISGKITEALDLN